MAITLLDGLLIGMVVVSGVLAMVRGFSREVLSISAWIAAALAAFFFYKQLSPLVAPYTAQVSSNPLLADAAAGGIIFLVTLIIVSLITMRVADFIVDSRVGPLDRTLGFVFGAVRGALLLVVALMFYNWLTPADQWAWVANAKSKPMLDAIGQRIEAMMPADGGKAVLERLAPSEPDEPAPADAEEPAAEPATQGGPAPAEPAAQGSPAPSEPAPEGGATNN